MQNVAQRSSKENANVDNVNANRHDIGNSPSTPNSSNNSSPDTDTYSERRRFMSDSSESEEDSVSEVESFAIDTEFDEDPQVEAAKFLLSSDEDRAVDPETQARLEALLQAAGIGQLTTKDGKLADPEVLRRLTSSVSCALDEAAAALTRMRTDNPRSQPEKTSIVEATVDGDVRTVRKLLGEGRSVHETSEEGESLLSLACSAGYFELAQVLLAMHANVEDRGIKGECTPLMEAASAGHLDIVRLLVAHGADVNAQSSSGNTPLMYGCAGGHADVVEFLLDNGANVEDHNENGHTPLMEAASAGYVELAKILLMRGAGINTHSNEFKESALTLACYKGHLDMVRFLLDAGADQEHKTDEMHTALMEASMDGHVEVARLLLDSGAQVNMPTDSFESPLTLAACGGHVDLAMLLIERGANIEEVNDEGYTPLMEAAREGHEEMVALLLSQGANINAQTEETQETALTLACCGGFSDVADFLIKAGADIERGASTPLMEAAQEGHLELVRYILESNGNVAAQTQTGDTALTYACENGHTDVAELLLEYHSDLEHESEGGRTPLMKACRAGHLCVVQFLIGKGANVNKQTTNNDHTPLSLACASGNLPVVELLLKSGADINHKLKDNSTMLIEAAKGGHTGIVQCLLDYPHSIMNQTVMSSQTTTPPNNGTANNYVQVPKVLQETAQLAPTHDTFQGTCAEAVADDQLTVVASTPLAETHLSKNLTHEAIRNMNTSESLHLSSLLSPSEMGEESHDEVSSNGSIIDYVENQKMCITPFMLGDANAQRHQILEDFQDSIERDLHGKQQFSQTSIAQPSLLPPSANSTVLQNVMNIGLPVTQQPVLGGTNISGSTIPINNNNLQVQNTFYTGPCLQPSAIKLASPIDPSGLFPTNPATSTYYFTPLTASISTSTTSPSIKFSSGSSHLEVSQNTAISDRPKAKPVSKKENKNLRKLYNPQQSPATSKVVNQTSIQFTDTPTAIPDNLNFQNLDLDNLDTDTLTSKNDFDNNVVNTPLLQFHNASQFCPSLRALAESTQRSGGLDLYESSLDPDKNLIDKDCYAGDLIENIVDPYNAAEVANQLVAASQMVTQHHTQAQSYPSLDEPILSTLPIPQDITIETDGTPIDYYMTSPNVSLHAAIAHGVYDQYHVANKDSLYQTSFHPGVNVVQQKLGTCTESFSSIASSSSPANTSTHQYLPTVQSQCVSVQSQISHLTTSNPLLGQTRFSQQNTLPSVHQQQTSPAITVQAATQTSQTAPLSTEKKQIKSVGIQEGAKVKKIRTSAKSQVQLQQPAVCQQTQNYQIDSSSAITQYNSNNQPMVQQAINSVVPPGPCLIDLDSETESNHDTALTLACAGGHDDLVELLIKRGADIEHRDKKGFTPLILAATAGHEKVVEALLNHGADIEAQSERTKDTPLSLACSGGRYEVVELLLNRGANKEHRNVSDYTPLSLAASGGYVNIIKLLLNHGAEINSRTGSKLGISPLMLAAMNGHTAAVKLLLDNGSDINAQIETNRNTALTLACFQGRHEVVSLLLERKANVEHRAKTGLTPLMEAASGGYVEVGKVLIAKGADVNATPVPSSRDTALTIAADKGHCRFVDLLLKKGAAVEVKNKKGNSPLWLAANGGHLNVVELLHGLKADIDSEDNRKVSCLMAAFRRGHVKVVKWMVNNVTQFPSDQDMNRYMSTLTEKDLLEKCNECTKIIRSAKEAQALKANKNASILLEQIDQEKNREEVKRQAAARKRERKKRKKMEKIEEKRRLNEENKKNESYNDGEETLKNVEEDIEKFEDEDPVQEVNTAESPLNSEPVDKEEGDSGIDANSQGSCSSNDVKPVEKRKEKKKKKPNVGNSNKKVENEYTRDSRSNASVKGNSNSEIKEISERRIEKSGENKNSRQTQSSNKKGGSLVFESSRHPAERDDFESTGNENHTVKNKKSSQSEESKNSPKQSGKRQEEDWKEVEGKKSRGANDVSLCRKVSVPNHAISRVIGRGGSNINAIRAHTGAHIEVDKQQKGQSDRCITIKGAKEATATAAGLINTLIKEPDGDAMQLLNNKPMKSTTSTTLWDKANTSTKNKSINKTQNTTQTTISTVSTTSITQQQKVLPILASSTITTTRPTAIVKPRGATATLGSRGSAPPRLVNQSERSTTGVQLVSNTQSTMSYTTAIMASSRGTTKTPGIATAATFAAKVTDTTSAIAATPTSQLLIPQKKSQTNQTTAISTIPSMDIQASQMSPKQPHNISAPMVHYHPTSQGKFTPFTSTSSCSGSEISGVIRQQGHSPPVSQLQSSLISSVSSHIEPSVSQTVSSNTAQEYSLFSSLGQPTWKQEGESHKPINFAAVTGGTHSQPASTKYVDNDRPVQVDASKAPGYRGGTCVSSPVSSKTSSNCTSPPNLSLNTSAYPNYQEPSQLPIGTMFPKHLPSMPSDILGNHYYSSAEIPPQLIHSDANMFKHVTSTGYHDMNVGAMILPPTELQQQPLLPPYPPNSLHPRNYSTQQLQPSASIASRLNPKAPDFSTHAMSNKQSAQMYNTAYPMPMNTNNTNMHMVKPGMANYRTSGGAPPSPPRWNTFAMQQKAEMAMDMPSMAVNMMRDAREETINNLHNVNTPTMSPNIAPSHNENSFTDDDRKIPPQPIGTERERNRRSLNQTMENWVEPKHIRGPWPGIPGDRFNPHAPPVRGSMDMDYNHPVENYSHRVAPLESSYLGSQQYPYGIPQAANARPQDYLPNEQIKLEMNHWETSRSTINDLHDKQPGWPNKWSQ